MLFYKYIKVRQQRFFSVWHTTFGHLWSMLKPHDWICNIWYVFSFFMSETKIPDSVESYRGNPWKQLCVHWPHTATIWSPVGVPTKQLAFWWACCTPHYQLELVLWLGLNDPIYPPFLTYCCIQVLIVMVVCQSFLRCKSWGLFSGFSSVIVPIIEQNSAVSMISQLPPSGYFTLIDSVFCVHRYSIKVLAKCTDKPVLQFINDETTLLERKHDIVDIFWVLCSTALLKQDPACPGCQCTQPGG